MRLAALFAMIALPAFAQGAPRSKAGTEFIEICLADLTEHRIARLKKQAPDYAATLSPKQLFEGASRKAEQVCPCFLQVIAVAEDVEGDTPEARVAGIVKVLRAESVTAVPPVMTRIARMCGQRGSMVPPHWFGG